MPVEWMLKGPEITSCNCDFSCPCQFNALPTHGDCRAAVAFRIDEGRFGDTDLAGVKAAALVAWPKAIHLGNGEVMPVVDPAANEAQREAVLKIMSGEETEPGATIFNVFAATYSKVHDPLFAPIDFSCDMEARTGGFSIPGIVEVRVEPIRNPVTGEPHRVRVELPHGFEYTLAEYASSRTIAEGVIPLDWSDGHAHLTELHWTQSGVVRH